MPRMSLSWQGAATSTRLPLKVSRSSLAETSCERSSGERSTSVFT